MVDVEAVLRRFGERQVAAAAEGDPDGPWTPVAVAAGALSAVGRLDPRDAAALAAEYDTASAWRRARPLGHGPTVTYLEAEVPPGPTVAPRVVPVARRFATEWGHLDVHYAVLSDRATELVVTLHLPPTRGLTAFGEPGLTGWTDTTLVVGDDQGATVTVAWSGADVHTAERRRGWLHAPVPLAADTRWLDVGDIRVELGAPAAPTAVRFTPGPPAVDAKALLVRLGDEVSRGRLTPPELYADPTRSPVEIILDTLTATGELAPDDPDITQIRLLVAARLTPGTPPPPGLTEPWVSLLDRTDTLDAPWAVRTLAGTMPAVNGLPFALVALTSTIAYAELRLVELAATGPIQPAPSELLEPQRHRGQPPGTDATTWTATDDLGHHHRGTFIRHGIPADRAYVMLPPLHPDATELHLTATGPDGRAELTVPLDWEEPT
jgi:hypothetical protein